MSKKENNGKKFTSSVKRSFKRLKYLDKTQASYFVVTTFIAAFCMFTSITYSYFTFSKHLNATTITIAKLNYTLESPTEGYKNQEVTVDAGETKIVELELRSLNGERTRYALNYETRSKDTKVYYSETLRKNVSGVIGARGSLIDLRIVIVNSGVEDAVVKFNIDGGYLQNSIKSNITEGYFEQDLTIRTVLYDENFDNPTQASQFPDKENYSFYKAECSNGVKANFDTNNWSLSRSDEEKQTSCDVYFKKSTEPLETYYQILGNNDTSRITKTKPDSTGLYKYSGSSCTNGTEYTFNESTNEFDVTKYDANTLCVATFKTDQTLENANRYTVYFDNNGGKSKQNSKVVLAGGTYGSLPIPTKEGNIFLGWYPSTSATEAVTPLTNVDVAGDVTLYARWQNAEQRDVTLSRLGVGEDDIKSTLDDYGTSYYFVGNTINNYLRFAGMNFRIIRVNGDGSLRIMYDGVEPYSDETEVSRVLESAPWNVDASDDVKYVGYTYGTLNNVASTTREEALKSDTDTNVKVKLENWYKKNIVNKGLAPLVSDAIYCNDRSTSDLGYGNNETKFGAFSRIANEDGTISEGAIPSLTCPNIEDRYTVRDTTKGNGMSNYPVGLPTVDEAILAGANTDTSYFNKGVSYWTMSPSRYTDAAYMYVVGTGVSESKVNEANAIVPVITLSAEYAATIEGVGTVTNPYVIR